MAGEIDVGSLVAHFKADVSGFVKAVNQVAGELSKIDSKTQASIQKLAAVGANIDKSFAPAIQAIEKTQAAMSRMAAAAAVTGSGSAEALKKLNAEAAAFERGLAKLGDRWTELGTTASAAATKIKTGAGLVDKNLTKINTSLQTGHAAMQQFASASSQSLGAVNRAARGAAQGAAHLGTSLRGAGGAGATAGSGISQSLTLLGRRIAFLTVGVYGLRTAFGALKTGIESAMRIQTAEIGLAASFAAQVKMTDATGKQLDVQERLNVAQGKMRATVQQTVKDSARLGISFQDMMTGLQAGLGPALRTGASLEQTQKFTTQVLLAMRALGLPTRLVREEVQALLLGQIDMNSTIAKTLRLRNVEVNTWAEQGTLMENVSKRLEAYEAAGKRIGDTLSGQFGALQAMSEYALRELTKDLQQVLSENIPKLTEFLGSEEMISFAHRFGRILADGLRVSQVLAAVIAKTLLIPITGLIKVYELLTQGPARAVFEVEVLRMERAAAHDVLGKKGEPARFRPSGVLGTAIEQFHPAMVQGKAIEEIRPLLESFKFAPKDIDEVIKRIILLRTGTTQARIALMEATEALDDLAKVKITLPDPKAEKLAAAWETADSALKTIQTRLKAFKLADLSGDVNVFETSLKKLVDLGVAPADARFKKLMDTLRAYEKQLEKTGAAKKKLTKTLAKRPPPIPQRVIVQEIVEARSRAGIQPIEMGPHPPAIAVAVTEEIARRKKAADAFLAEIRERTEEAETLVIAARADVSLLRELGETDEPFLFGRDSLERLGEATEKMRELRLATQLVSESISVAQKLFEILGSGAEDSATQAMEAVRQFVKGFVSAMESAALAAVAAALIIEPIKAIISGGTTLAAEAPLIATGLVSIAAGFALFEGAKAGIDQAFNALIKVAQAFQPLLDAGAEAAGEFSELTAEVVLLLAEFGGLRVVVSLLVDVLKATTAVIRAIKAVVSAMREMQQFTAYMQLTVAIGNEIGRPFRLLNELLKDATVRAQGLYDQFVRMFTLAGQALKQLNPLAATAMVFSGGAASPEAPIGSTRAQGLLPLGALRTDAEKAADALRAGAEDAGKTLVDAGKEALRYDPHATTEKLFAEAEQARNAFAGREHAQEFGLLGRRQGSPEEGTIALLEDQVKIYEQVVVRVAQVEGVESNITRMWADRLKDLRERLEIQKEELDTTTKIQTALRGAFSGSFEDLLAPSMEHAGEQLINGILGKVDTVEEAFTQALRNAVVAGFTEKMKLEALEPLLRPAVEAAKAYGAAVSAGAAPEELAKKRGDLAAALSDTAQKGAPILEAMQKGVDGFRTVLEEFFPTGPKPGDASSNPIYIKGNVDVDSMPADQNVLPERVFYQPGGPSPEFAGLRARAATSLRR